MKRKAQMPNMEKLISRTSRKTVDGPADEIWISKFDLDYVYGQLILSRAARNLCIFAVIGGNFTGYYRFLKGFYVLADIPTIFQEKIDQTLQNKHLAWLDDIIVVTKGSKEEQTKELIDVLTKLENAGYRLSETNLHFSNRDRMDRSPDRPGRNPTIASQATGDKKIKTTKQRERAKITSGSYPVFVKIH